MKINIIRKNTGLNGISIERQIEIPDYDMTLLKLSTMTPYLEGRRVHKTLDHNKKKDIPLNMIIYKASEKLTETTSKPYPTSGLKTNEFSDLSGQKLTITSHTFENGVGIIEFNGDIASIDRYAFSQCSGLTSVTIPDSVTSIGDSAFQSCTGLTSVTIPDSVASIGIMAFSDCNNLTNITIPNSVTSIGKRAFNNTPWWSVYSADVSNQYGNIIYINDMAYKATTTTITNCEFKNGTVSISDDAFRECKNLTSVTIPNSVTSIGVYAFYSCSGLVSVTIGNGITSISSSAFEGCGLTSIVIPNSVTSIGESAFKHCNSLTSIEIPDSVTSIGSSAFAFCGRLTSITIPNSVTRIGYNAFYNCSDLVSITSLAMIAPIIDKATFQNVETNGTLTVPNGSSGYDVWMGTDKYYLGYYSWDSNVPYICKLTLNNGNTVKLYGSGELTSVMMSDYKSTLVSAEIENACTSISNEAFSGCTSLTSVTIPISVTSIGYSAFWGCSGLTSINIPNSVTSIDFGAFEGCTSLTSISIPNSVTSIGYKAFDNTPWWNTYSADTSHQYGNIIYINDVAYKAVSTAITSCEFKNGTISISSRAFSGCSSLTSVTIPNSVTSIGYFAFCSCPLDAISKAAIEAINPDATKCPMA